MRSLFPAKGLVVSLAIVLSSCGGSDGKKGDDGGTGGVNGGDAGSGTGGVGGTGNPPPSFMTVKTIFMGASCGLGTCHIGGGATLPSAMNLDTGAGTELVGVDSIECASMGGRKRVAAGSPGTSYLLDKLKGTNLCSGARMPLNLPPLSASEIGIIEDWIAGGAPTTN